MFLRSFFILFFLALSVNSFSQVKLLTLSELETRLSKGKDTTYVINFWATWCAPCVEELPYFEKLTIEKKEKPVKVILMSLDFKSKMNSLVIPFVKKHNLKSEVYVINEPDQQVFIERVNKDWSGAIPATWILNKAKGIKLFYEKAFTEAELKTEVAKVLK